MLIYMLNIYTHLYGFITNARLSLWAEGILINAFQNGGQMPSFREGKGLPFCEGWNNYTPRNIFEILLNQPEIRLYSPFFG